MNYSDKLTKKWFENNSVPNFHKYPSDLWDNFVLDNWENDVEGVRKLVTEIWNIYNAETNPNHPFNSQSNI